MYQDKVVLCGANSYEEKYYLNPDFDRLPDHVKDELKIMCVLYVNDVGGILTLVFEEDGELCFEVTSEDFDPTLISLEAPVVMEWNTTSSAARPPVRVAILFSSSSLFIR